MNSLEQKFPRESFLLRSLIEEITVPKVKQKTRKAVASRFKVTGTGKLVRGRPGKRHILTKKSSKRKRKLGTPALVSDAHLKMYKTVMGVA